MKWLSFLYFWRQCRCYFSACNRKMTKTKKKTICSRGAVTLHSCIGPILIFVNWWQWFDWKRSIFVIKCQKIHYFAVFLCPFCPFQKYETRGQKLIVLSQISLIFGGVHRSYTCSVMKPNQNRGNGNAVLDDWLTAFWSCMVMLLISQLFLHCGKECACDAWLYYTILCWWSHCFFADFYIFSSTQNAFFVVERISSLHTVVHVAKFFHLYLNFFFLRSFVRYISSPLYQTM